MTSEKKTDILDGAIESAITLEIEDLEYEYDSKDYTFQLGPINLKASSSEILFITGGNGSGKTTLAKLLTGLYKPQRGRILVNGNEIAGDQLGAYDSHVFSDFYLFKKLYGIDYVKKHDEIEETLNVLHMQDNIQITDGEFSTLKLSTGQRKRLALLVSYLEDKQIFLFDEWAADQDPDFRQYFYQEFLCALKKKGKCVIAITHDDRYFDVADTVVKMEMGKIKYVKKAVGSDA
jgi:ABC-type siderophore export system fused ATPase/permease subunit